MAPQAAAILYLHGEGGRLLVVVVEDVGHEGGVVRQPLAHAQRDGLTGEQAVTPRRRIHRNGHARREHGDRQHPQEVHGRWAAEREETRETSGKDENTEDEERMSSRRLGPAASSAQPRTDVTEGRRVHRCGRGGSGQQLPCLTRPPSPRRHRRPLRGRDVTTALALLPLSLFRRKMKMRMMLACGEKRSA